MVFLFHMKKAEDTDIYLMEEVPLEWEEKVAVKHQVSIADLRMPAWVRGEPEIALSAPLSV